MVTYPEELERKYIGGKPSLLYVSVASYFKDLGIPVKTQIYDYIHGGKVRWVRYKYKTLFHCEDLATVTKLMTTGGVRDADMEIYKAKLAMRMLPKARKKQEIKTQIKVSEHAVELLKEYKLLVGHRSYSAVIESILEQLL